MSEITILLPIYNSKHIAWIALESLARQKDIKSNWELIIAEEQDSTMFGKNNIVKIIDKIPSCVDLKYIEINKHINLSHKYEIMVREIHKDSRICIVCAADNYTQPFRISETINLFNDPGVDWVHTRFGQFLDLKTWKSYLYDHERCINSDKRPGVAFAMRSDLFRHVEPMNEIVGNDSWIWNQCVRNKGSQLNIVWNNNDTWKNNLFTRGLNNLSSPQRHWRGRELKGPYTVNTININDHVPKDILDRLKEVSKYVHR